MNCPNCGKESVEGAKFCESCGAPLVSGVSEPAAPVPPAPASPFNAPEPSMPIGTNAAQPSAPQAPVQTQSGYAPYEPPAQPYGTQNGYAATNANTQQGYYAQPDPLATKPLPERIPSTVWPACLSRRIRWRDLPHVRFRSHIAPH